MGGSQSRYIDTPSINKMKLSVTTSKCSYNAGSAKWNCETTRTSTPNNSNNATYRGNTMNTKTKNCPKNTKAPPKKAAAKNSDEYFTFFE